MIRSYHAAGPKTTTRCAAGLNGMSLRENEHIDWDWIVDETRQAERISSWDDPLSFVNDVKRAYRRDMWQDQSEHIEVWSEKGTVRGTLGPVLDEYGVTFRVHHGSSSATSLHQAAEDSLDQPFIARYVGDFDPSGMHISEIDLPDRLDRYGGEIEIVRIALLTDDAEHLPGFSVEEKRKDPRYGWFVANHGRRCWELDAMSPVDLRARVKTEICSYIDEEAWDLARKPRRPRSRPSTPCATTGRNHKSYFRSRTEIDRADR